MSETDTGRRPGTPVPAGPARIRARIWARIWALAAAALLALSGPAAARDHHVAAAGAAGTGGDGSAAAPWPSVAAALDSGRVAGGDTLLLAPGRHGPLRLRGIAFEPPVTIGSAPGGRAHVDQIEVRNSSGLTIRDLDVWYTDWSTRVPGPMVHAAEGTEAIVFADLDIRIVEAGIDYRDWDAETWRTYNKVGARLAGQGIVLRDSVLTGVRGGILMPGPGSQAIDNEIRGFSRDGLRIFGRGSVIRGNTIRDCVKIDGNHDDAMQSWVGKNNPDGAVIDIKVIGNRILEWTGPLDHPMRCTLQGIGLFDGPYRDWVIENNLIVVRAHHGIALYDMHGARVVNNTVVHLLGESGKKPWIRLDKSSRDGSNTIANNVAMGLMLGKAGTLTDNLKITDPATFFTNPAQFDYRPKPGGPLIDAADPALAPAADINGRRRSGLPDLGAYEGS